MWAFALYDFKEKLLFASRDRFKVKPFFYYLDEEAFAFSSEIKGLLQFKSFIMRTILPCNNPSKFVRYSSTIA